MQIRSWGLLLAIVGGTILSFGPAWAQAAAEPETGNWLLRSYRAGGWFIHPIFLSWLVATAVTLERIWAISRDRSDRAGVVGTINQTLKTSGPVTALTVAQKEKGPLARVLAHGLSRAEDGREGLVRGMEAAAAIEIYQMERGLLWLATVASIAPLLGFLGTVSGMIHAFEDIAQADQVSARIVAAGISEALITTAAGLLVAIPTQTVYNFFVGRIDRFQVEVEEASEELLHSLAVSEKEEA